MPQLVKSRDIELVRVTSPSCNAEIQLSETLGDNLKNKEIIVTCRTGNPCTNHLGNIFENERCYALCVVLLGLHENLHWITIRTKERTLSYSKEQLQTLEEHFREVQKCRTYLTNHLDSCLNRFCQSRENCLQQLWTTGEKVFSIDPIPGLAYTSECRFRGRFRLGNRGTNDEKPKMLCDKCKSNLSRLEKELEKILFKRTICRSELSEASSHTDPKRQTTPSSQLIKKEDVTPSPIQLFESGFSGRLLDSYEIPTHRIEILDPITPSKERLYYPVKTLNRLELDLAEEISRRLRSTAGGKRIQSFSELLKERINRATSMLKTFDLDLTEKCRHRISLISTYHSLNMMKMLPYLLDDEVEEIFLDTIDTKFYIDHRKWGRCATPTGLTISETKTLETRIRTESGLRLDRSSPSIKTDIITRDFRARFSVDIAPLATGGFSLDIRKLRRTEFTLPELIKNGTLPSIAAAYLFFLLSRRRNITVIGEPGSGKTTLINSLDLLTPKKWRKITIEDTIESVDQTRYGKHQTRFKVHPFESRTEYLRNKSSEIVKLLHRAPDWIYLGEIQTPEHTRAMFHALSAGLRGLQTTHAATPKEAVHRWVAHHDIPPICLNDLDTIIHIKKLDFREKTPRRVVQICEVDVAAIESSEKRDRDLTLPDISIRNIFAWNPKDQMLMPVGDPWNSLTVQKIRDYEKIDKTSFEVEIETYKRLLEHLTEKEVFEVERNVELFHQVNVLRERGELFRFHGLEKLHRTIEEVVEKAQLGS